jgi:DNA-directed RNA polymerase II subunit RPB2
MSKEVDILSSNTVKSFFDTRSLAKVQIDSYDYWVQRVIPQSIEELCSFSVSNDHKTIQYKFSNVTCVPVYKLESDGISTFTTPNICRQRDLTYQSDVYATVDTIETELESVQVPNRKHVKRPKTMRVLVCKIPVMLGSCLCVLRNKTEKEVVELGECPRDPGGYFVVNGGEKVLIAQERLANNNVYVFNAKGNILSCEIRSMHPSGIRAPSQLLLRLVELNKKEYSTDSVIRVLLPYCKKEVPLFVVFRAFGLTTEEDTKSIIKMCGEDNASVIQASVEDAIAVQRQDQALEYIALRANIVNNTKESRIEWARNIVQNEILPHLEETLTNDDTNKVEFIAYMVRRLLLVSAGKRDLDDRDNYSNKRMDMAETLLGVIFKSSLIRIVKEFKLVAETKLNNNNAVTFQLEFNSLQVTKDLKFMLSTGNWGVSRQKMIRTGVTQVLSRLTYLATVSHIRRVIAPLAKEGKLRKPRQLHNSSYGLLDSNDTPEGQICGLVKNFSLTTLVSLASDSSRIEEIIRNCPVNINVFVNGKLIKSHKDADDQRSEAERGRDSVQESTTTFSGTDLVRLLRQSRRAGEVALDTSIMYDFVLNEVRVYTDQGRCCRPLFVCENLYKDSSLIPLETLCSYSFDEHLQSGRIEYIDAAEEEELLIAVRYAQLEGYDGRDFTHCEIHPSMMMSICSGLLPYPHHNPAPRVTYAAGQSRQGMGLYASNYNLRYDTMAHVLFYPQKPLIDPKIAGLVKLDDVASGHNVICAIACYGGFTIWFGP